MVEQSVGTSVGNHQSNRSVRIPPYCWELVGTGTSYTMAIRKSNRTSEGDSSSEAVQSEKSHTPRPVTSTIRGHPPEAKDESTAHPSHFRYSNLAYSTLFLMLGISTPSLRRVWDSYRRSTPVESAQRVLSESSRKLQNPHPPHPCSREGALLPNFWHDHPEPGLHIVCIRDNEADFFRDSLESNLLTVQFTTPDELEPLFGQHLGLPSKGPHKWAVFTHRGEKIFDQGSFDARRLQRDHELVLVFEGGVWRWPGVRKGFQRKVELAEGNSIILETLALSPLVLMSRDFLTISECQEIQEAAAPSLMYSDVVLMDQDAGRPATDFRTSSSTFLTKATPLMRTLNDRTADFLKIPRTHQEHLQVLKYQVGEKYDIHDDFFDPAKYQNDPGTLQATENGHRNRMATFFWYLSNVTAGGETSFPKVNGRRPSSMLDCSKESLLVRPEMGKVVLFYSMKADGKLDFRSTHAACPVREGIKWAANKWVWNKPMRYVK